MVKIKKTTGHVVHSPLNVVFQMLELGGSYVQKYDAGTGEYTPDRELTPFVMMPQLILSDPDGVMSTGDYSSSMVNCTWDLRLVAGSAEIKVNPPDYTVNKSNYALTLYMNINPGCVLKCLFTADYLDKRRNETIPLRWEKQIITEAQSGHNVTLDTGRWSSKVRLSPFKKWGEFKISVQLKYGDESVPDDKASYEWQMWDEDSRSWVTTLDDEAWYVSGKDSKVLTVDQDYIQNVLVRVKAIAFGESYNTKYFVTRLKRWYGQYEEDVDFVTGKYIFSDTNMVVIECKVTNRQGNIDGITNYFDAEVFFGVGTEDLESVGYGEEVTVRRSDLQSGTPKAGILIRELTAFMPIADDDGAVITDDDGTPIFAQFPTTEKEE